MSILSLNSRKKTSAIVFTAVLASSVWLLQVTVLNNFFFESAICNLPLTMTILWGFVFGSPLPPVTLGELRISTVGEIFVHQLMSGSLSAVLVGAFLAALYASVLPVYPIALPIVGWIAGYFSARHLNQDTLLCIPVVLLMTVLGELIMAAQLAVTGHADVFQHLSQIALPEALLNGLIAPFIYFPMRRWYDFSQTTTS